MTLSFRPACACSLFLCMAPLCQPPQRGYNRLSSIRTFPREREADMATDTHTATELVFALDDDVPIPYMQRTRDYYLALGYNNPYRWAHFVEVPFTPLRKPLAASRLALITTAAP